MLKKIAFASSLTLLASFATSAFAADNTIGFQFRIPFQATADKNVGNVYGQSILLTFFMDQETEVGILNETINLKDKSVAPAVPVVTGYEVNAIRISKNVLTAGSSPVYVGLDLGNINVFGGAVSVGASTMADVFGGVKLLTSKGKVASFIGVELGYRMAKPTLTGTSSITDMGGAMLNLSAGLNF